MHGLRVSSRSAVRQSPQSGAIGTLHTSVIQIMYFFGGREKRHLALARGTRGLLKPVDIGMDLVTKDCSTCGPRPNSASKEVGLHGCCVVSFGEDSSFG